MRSAYNVDENTRKLIEKRAAHRSELKQAWRRMVSSPYPEHYNVLDPQLIRHHASRMALEQHARPTKKGFFYSPFVFIGFWALFSWALIKDKTEFDTACRTGRIAYKDRLYKFAS